jgi:hypothetical protein
MGIELFGSEHAVLFGIACFTAYLFSGHTSIYSAQRIALPKIFETGLPDQTLKTQTNKRWEYLYKKLYKYRVDLRKRKL